MPDASHPLPVQRGEGAQRAGEGRTESGHLSSLDRDNILLITKRSTRESSPRLPLIRPRIQYGAGSSGTFSPPSGENDSQTT